MSEVKVNRQVYTTVLLHCAKYPASAVTGVLVGNTSGMLITQAIPLQHHWNQLSPMVEVGLSLIQAHCASQASSNSHLLGVYFASSNAAATTKNELDPTAIRIGQLIATKLGKEAVALQVDNAKLGSQNDALIGYSVSAFTTQAKTIPVKLSDRDTVDHAKAEIAKGTWKQLVDFDDHLEDTSRDWLHPVEA